MINLSTVFPSISIIGCATLVEVPQLSVYFDLNVLA